MSKELIERLREAAAQRVASTAMIGAEDLSAAADALESQAATPSSHWRVEGAPDPHAGHYDGERAALAMGKLTDDELANGAFMNYDQPLNLAGIIAGTHSSPIAWMTAVKDRIRWLSRSLERVAAERDALANRVYQLEQKNSGAAEIIAAMQETHAEDQAELKALREQKPVARIDDDESFQGPCRHAMAFVPMHRGSPLYAHPVPARELTDEEILNALDGKVGTQFLTTPVTCKEFWLTAGSVDVREFVRAIEAAIKGEGK